MSQFFDRLHASVEYFGALITGGLMMGHFSKRDGRRFACGWLLATGGWLVAVLGVWAWMTSYACTGNLANASIAGERWQASAGLALALDRPTMLLFLHPHCPCSRAVLEELDCALVNIERARQPKLILIVAVPEEAPADWFATQSIQRAQRLPNAEVHWDVGGVETARFSAVNSGDIRVFRSDGQLLFGGGITVARGHAGSSAGADALIAALNNPTHPAARRTPVFGCPLAMPAMERITLKSPRTSVSVTQSVGAMP